jgi:hypothetical protein
MANRHISIDYDFRPDEPNEAYTRQIRQAFAEFGWTVTQYGGGSSNVHRCFLAIESEDRPLDHPTLIATLKRLGIPLTENPFTGTLIAGDVSMERRSVEWAHGRAADVADVHVEFLDVAPRGSFELEGRRVPQLGVRCIVSPRGTSPLRFPLAMEVIALREDEKRLGFFHRTVTSSSHLGETILNIPTAEQVATVHLLVRLLDMHRAGEVVFRSVPLTSAWTS